MHYELWDIRKDKTIYGGGLLDCIYFAELNNLMDNNYHIAEICKGYVEPIELMTVSEWSDMVFDEEMFGKEVISTDKYTLWISDYCYKLNINDEIFYYDISSKGKQKLLLKLKQTSIDTMEVMQIV